MTGESSDPRGRLRGVPPPLRRLWSLLYRATRRNSTYINGLLLEVSDLRARVELLERRSRGEGPP